MSNRMKEDEKHERIIRGLLKLPENRRCINCNSLGPQYVCTNFWTFVCTTCSGIHREFTHRVKSVSMAKFTLQEVTSLQGGGNQCAREVYFKEWDLQRQSAPDSSNVERLRDFIRHVYVDGRYTGDRNFSKPPSGKLGDKEGSYDNRRMEAYEKGSRSPPYEDSYERRYSERSKPVGSSDDKYSRYSYDERRSPGYDQENRQYNDQRRSPARPEIVNGWRRDDRFGNDGDSKHEARSPEMPREAEASSPPVVRPMREILGDNVFPLRISEPPKATVGRTVDGSAQTQRTTSSSSLGSTNGNTGDVKLETIKSLIDFDADLEPPAAVAVPQTEQAAISQSVAQPESSANDNNWASFDFTPDIKAPQPPSNANSLDSILSQFSVVPSGPNHLLGTPSAVIPSTGASFVAPVGTARMSPFNPSAHATTQINNLTLPAGGLAPTLSAGGLAPTLPANGGNSLDKVVEAGKWPSMLRQQSPLFPASTSISSAQHFIPEFPGSPANQQTWNLSAVPNVQSLTTSVGARQIASPETTVSGVSQPSSGEVKSSGRGALPEDLFSTVYSPSPSPVPGWQTGTPGGVGFMSYSHVAAPVQNFSQPLKPANPFDLNEPVQAQPFPTMASLQSALPNMPPPSGLQHTVSLGASSLSWMPSQSFPYPSTLPLQTPSYAAAMLPRVTMAQQLHGGMPPLTGHQVTGSLVREGASFGAINIDQQVAGRFSAPPTPQPFSSVGGNPFG